MCAEKWTQKGFLSEIRHIHESMIDRRFVFIFGAGASVSSGIRAASKLADEWISKIFERETDNCDYHDWLKSNPLEVIDWDIDNLAIHYPQIFERCFQGDHDSGFAALENEIEGKTPSIGYAVLAWILSTTRHNMVITTNFDNLVADAVTLYGGKSPLVIGHEYLASYVKPISRRPIVAKLHRDLFTDPINTCNGTDKLNEQWERNLKEIFKLYTPIFIGYGGNDGSLMNFLNSLEVNDISGRPFWCTRKNSTINNSLIKDFLALSSGITIKADDFDEIMILIAECLGFNRQEYTQSIKKHSNNFVGNIEHQIEFLNKKTNNKDVIKILQPTDKNKENWSWMDFEIEIEQADKSNQDELYRAALKYLPHDPSLLGNYAIFLSNEGDKEEAERLYRLALSYDDEHSYVLNNYAILLQKLNRCDEAEKFFIKAIETNAQHPNSIGNYAAFLHKKNRLNEAENMYARALVEGNIEYKAFNLNNFADCLLQLGYVERASNMIDQAIKLEPDNNVFIETRGEIYSAINN